MSIDPSIQKLALVSLDKGPGAEAGADLGNYLPLPAVLAAIPTAAPALVAAYANDTAGISKGGLRIFGGGAWGLGFSDAGARACVYVYVCVAARFEPPPQTNTQPTS